MKSHMHTMHHKSVYIMTYKSDYTERPSSIAIFSFTPLAIHFIHMKIFFNSSSGLIDELYGSICEHGSKSAQRQDNNFYHLNIYCLQKN